MKKYLIPLMLCASVLLQGCTAIAAAAQIPQIVAAAQQPADRFFHTLADEKAYYGLLRFEQAANNVASAAVDMGFITPNSPTAQTVARLLRQLTAIVQTAQRLKALNDAPGVRDKIEEGKALYHQIMGLLGR